MEIKYDIIIIEEGTPIIDSETALLLSLIDKKGSLLKAVRELGIPYSRAWEKINKAEKILGEKLVETWKGGGRKGGTRLTPRAVELVRILESHMKVLEQCIGKNKAYRAPVKPPDLIVSYSHDHLIELAVEEARKNGLLVEGIHPGSSRALAMLSLGETDIACIHLFDPEKSQYNKTYLEKYYIEKPVLLGGFLRELVMAYNPSYSFESLGEILDELNKGILSLANRNDGSGTRVYLDFLLSSHNVDTAKVKGYNRKFYTHDETVKAIALGMSGVGLVARYYAERYGLPFVHVTWERYECYTTGNKIDNRGVKVFRDILNSEWMKELVGRLPGYKALRH